MNLEEVNQIIGKACEKADININMENSKQEILNIQQSSGFRNE